MPRKTFTVTHPDGTVSKRTSQSRDYAFAVVVASSKATRLAEARKDEAEAREAAERHEAAQTGAVTEERKPWAFGGTYVTLCVGGEYAGSYIEGGKNGRGVRPTGEALRAKVAATAARYRENEANCAASAKEIEAGPECVYSVIRWSVSEKNATTAANGKEFAFYRDRGHDLSVVPVVRA